MRLLRVRVGSIVAVCLAAVSIVVWAQVDTPTQVSFTCSADQATLTGYQVRSVVDATSVASSPVSVGLPTPVLGVCTVSISTSGWTHGVEYRIEVRSVRGSSVSAWVETARTGVVPVGPDPPPPVDPNAYYVATTGLDSRSCVTAQDITTPKRSLNSAMACLSAGSTLYVRAGTYAESLLNNVPSGTSWSATVRIAAYAGETVWMHPTSGSYVVNLRGSSRYIDFDGINIDGDDVISNAVKIESYSDANNPHHIRMQNAEILGASTTADTDQSRVGILVTNVAGSAIGGNQFLNLTIHRLRSKYIGTANQGSLGLYLQSGNNLVEDCEFYDFRYGAFQIYNGYGFKGNDNIIRRNKIHDPTSVSGAAHVGMVVYSTTSGTQIYNNLIYNIQSNGANTKGVEYGSSASGVGFFYNTIYNVSGIGLSVQGSANTVRNVIAYGNSTNSSLAAGTTQSNNLFGTNPLFVSAGSGNFHLLVGSPAISAGVAVGGISTDFDVVTRGAPPDIGAYEYVP